MEQQNHGSPSFINIAALLLFAIVIAVASVATTYFILNSRSNEQYSPAQSSVAPPQSYIQPTSPPIGTTNQTVPDEMADWKVYRNVKYKYEVKYPNDWKYQEYQLNPQYILSEVGFDKSPAPLGTQGGNAILIDVLPISLQEAMNEFGQNNIQEISRTDITIANNTKAKKLIGKFYGTLGGPIEAYEGTTRTAIFIEKNNKVYELRFDSKVLNSPKIFDQMLSTFEFLE